MGLSDKNTTPPWGTSVYLVYGWGGTVSGTNSTSDGGFIGTPTPLTVTSIVKC